MRLLCLLRYVRLCRAFAFVSIICVDIPSDVTIDAVVRDLGSWSHIIVIAIRRAHEVIITGAVTGIGVLGPGVVHVRHE